MQPYYKAKARLGFYTPIQYWGGNFTYSRRTNFANEWPSNGQMPSYLFAHLAGLPSVEVTQSYRPVMAPFPFGNPDEPHLGAIPNGDTFYERDASLWFADGLWTFARASQVLVEGLANSRIYHTQWKEALNSRRVDDLYTTVVYHTDPERFDTDRTSLLYDINRTISQEDIPSLRVLSEYVIESNNLVKVTASVNPCVQILRARGIAGFLRTRQYLSSTMAFHDAEPPGPVAIPSKPAEQRKFREIRAVNSSSDKVFTASSKPIVKPVYKDNGELLDVGHLVLVQPFWLDPNHPNDWTDSWAADLNATLALAIATYQERLNYFLSVPESFPVGIAESPEVVIEPAVQFFANQSVFAAFSEVIAQHFPSLTPADFVTPAYQWVPVYIAGRIVSTGGDGLWSTASGTNTFSPGFSYYTGEPFAWDHTKAEFENLVPFDPVIWKECFNFVSDYIKTPDDRFDGMRFISAVRKSSVTRNWQAEVRNEIEVLDEEETVAGLDIKHEGWLDAETGEITLGSNPEVCSLPYEELDFSGWFSIEVVQPPGSSFWNNIQWPIIALPPSQFLLQDGSDAPLFPTFTGAFVFDTHLKKWGQFTGDHLQLLDYQAINNFKPNQQSYEKFSIFGGVVDPDGVIRIFNEKPADSFIKYGKIGYYRQGMTTLAEARVHHASPATGRLTIQTSLEGKTFTPALTVHTDFVRKDFWQQNGGFSGRWHNIVISGVFDLSYMELRGSKQGKR